MTENYQKALARHLSAPRQTVTAKILEREGALETDLKPFLVTYRIKTIKVPGKGDYDQRRNAVIEGIDALSGEKHFSTSAWKVMSRHGSVALCALLSEPLDARYDFLSVTPIGTSRTFGNAKLED